MSAQHNDHPTHQNFLSDDVAGKCHTHTHTHRRLVIWSVSRSLWWLFAWVWSQQYLKIKRQPIKYNKDQIHETNKFQIPNNSWNHEPVDTHTVVVSLGTLTHLSLQQTIGGNTLQ